MNGHKSDFQLYATVKLKKIDDKHLICHNIYHFQVGIVDLIHADNNNEHQLEELLSRKECKWISDYVP